MNTICYVLRKSCTAFKEMALHEPQFLGKKIEGALGDRLLRILKHMNLLLLYAGKLFLSNDMNKIKA
jgi:hypothetical protein